MQKNKKNKYTMRAMWPSLLMIAALLIYNKVGKPALVPILVVLCVAAVSYVIIATVNDRRARREEALKAAAEAEEENKAE